MLAGRPGDRYGRRDSLKILAVLFFVSAAGCAFCWDWYSLLVFRFIGGLGVGGASVLGPMYIAEIAPARWRGRLVGFFQINVVFGILIAYFSNYIVGLLGLGDLEWRWKFGVEAFPAALFFFALYTIPRSPRWLVKQRQLDEARRVLVLTGEENVEQELQEIVDSMDARPGRASDSLFTRKYRLPIFLAVSLAMFSQLTGINAILYYLNDIFASAGFDKTSSDLQSVAIGAANIFATLLAMLFIDKIGRKKLLLFGSVGTALCLGGVAAIFITNQQHHKLVWLLVAYIMFFASSHGAVVWVYIGEVFPNRVRASGYSLGSSTHWIMNAFVAGMFPLLAAASGGYPFLFFSLMMVLQFFAVLFLYPETKGLSLEEMQKKLRIS